MNFLPLRKAGASILPPHEMTIEHIRVLIQYRKSEVMRDPLCQWALVHAVCTRIYMVELPAESAHTIAERYLELLQSLYDICKAGEALRDLRTTMDWLNVTYPAPVAGVTDTSSIDMGEIR